MLSNSFKIVNTPEIVISYRVVTRNSKGEVIDSSFKNISLAEFADMKADERPTEYSIQVQNISVDDFNKGTVTIDVPEKIAKDYSLSCRVVSPKAGDSWTPFIAGTLRKNNKLTADQEKALADLF